MEKNGRDRTATNSISASIEAAAITILEEGATQEDTNSMPEMS
jgi:hypothetical protein